MKTNTLNHSFNGKGRPTVVFYNHNKAVLSHTAFEFIFNTHLFYTLFCAFLRNTHFFYFNHRMSFKTIRSASMRCNCAVFYNSNIPTKIETVNFMCHTLQKP